MRTLSLIIVLFKISLITIAQKSVDGKITGETCNCLKQIKPSSEMDILNCFQRAMEKNQELVIKQYSITDTSYENGYKFGAELFQRLSVNMVFSCDVFYKLMDTLRYSGIIGINKDSIRAELININKTDQNSRNKNFLLSRGQKYFAIMDLENALKDFNKVLESDQNSIQGILYKAFILELKKEYDEAIKLYKQLVPLTNRPEFNLFAAIVQRKKTDSRLKVK